MSDEVISLQTMNLVHGYLNTLVKSNLITDEQCNTAISKLMREDLKSKSLEPARLLNRKEVARLLGFKTERSVDKLEKQGILQRVAFPRTRTRYRVDDVQKLIDLQR